MDMLLCEMCNIYFYNEKSRQEHVHGKKHQLAVHQKQMIENKEKCGIYINGFPNLIEQEELLNFLSTYGKIVDSYFPNDNRFAIVQFDSPQAVNTLVDLKLTFRGKLLNIKRRVIKTKSDQDNTRPTEAIENLDIINESLKHITDFNTQLTMLIREIQPNWLEMVNKYRTVCFDLQRTLQQIFPNCSVHPFGSTVTKLGFISSDVDMYVDISKSPRMFDTVDRAASLVNQSKNLLQSCPDIFSLVCAIPRAKTPIVKCLHKPTKINCDFNFKSMLGVCNSDLIYYYLSLDRKLTQTMIIIKYWAKVHDLSGSSGKFSNYSLIMLLLFHLQQSPYSLPSVLTLQDIPNFFFYQEGWNGAFMQLKYTSNYLSSITIPQLLYNFFDYYSNFDYSLNIISPYCGRTILKTDFLRPEMLSNVFTLYKRNITNKNPIKINTSICIQDPFEHNHNITSSVPVKLLDEFIGLCKVGVNIFKNHPTGDSALYKLFTDEMESIYYQKYINDNNTCIFKIPMGNYLLYLDHKTTIDEKVTLDPQEKLKNLRSAWYELINEFILTILTKVMKFTILVKTEESEIKVQRLNDQNDVHNTNVTDSVTFYCTGIYNLWETRNSISKDISIEECIPILEKQIYLTEYMSSLYQDIHMNSTIIEFDMCLQAKYNPTEMVCSIINRDPKKSVFKSFAVFAAKNIPLWFKKYITELDESIQLKTDNVPEKESQD